MNTLKILDWNRPNREVDFIGYSTTGCYIYNEDHKRCAIDLWPPSGFSLKLTMPPDAIRRTILYLPSFNLAPQELVAFYYSLKAQIKSAPARDPFPLVTVHPRKKWDAPDLAKKLRNGLNENLRRLRHEYEAEKQKIAKRPVSEQEQALRELEYLFSLKRQDFSTASVFDATLADVKAGLFGLQEKILQEEFMKHYRLDLQQMDVERARFYQTIRLNGADLVESTGERMAKRVRYRIHLKDNTDFWLEGIHERPLTTLQEVEEFDKLEAASEIVGNERMSRDTVCRVLTVKRKGESKRMTAKGLEKLCAKAHVPFKFPMAGSVVKKLEEHRRRRRNYRIEGFKKYIPKPPTYNHWP